MRPTSRMIGKRLKLLTYGHDASWEAFCEAKTKEGDQTFLKMVCDDGSIVWVAMSDISWFQEVKPSLRLVDQRPKAKVIPFKSKKKPNRKA